MDERQWQECTDPEPMLEYLRHRANARKLRLFACACCRHAWGRLPHLIVADQDEVTGIEVAERFADGMALQEELFRAFDELERHGDTRDSPARFATDLRIAGEVKTCADFAIYAIEDDGVSWADERGEQASILRCLFGNPFRSVRILPAVLAWSKGLVPRLAQAAYDERQVPAGTFDPARLAVLADALEEAGCDDVAIMEHLRSPGPHYRGCHALDAILAIGVSRDRDAT